MLVDMLESSQVVPSEDVDVLLASLGSASLNSKISLAQLLRRPELSITDLIPFAPTIAHFERHIASQAEVGIKYAGYLSRQLEMISRSKKMETSRLPPNIDYGAIIGLSCEVREKLVRIRPQSIGQAARIPGITPAAISLLSVYLRKHSGQNRLGSHRS
jgi:tRNA uridine 5-carboxymethylaminomethyl modification enzyme